MDGMRALVAITPPFPGGVRVILDLASGQRDRLATVAAAYGVDPEALVPLALSSFLSLLEAQRDGDTILIERRNGTLNRVELGKTP